jgi:hypothetical protein
MKCRTSANREWWLSGGGDGEGGKPANCVQQLLVLLRIILHISSPWDWLELCDLVLLNLLFVIHTNYGRQTTETTVF